MGQTGLPGLSKDSPLRLSLDEQEVLFNAKEGAPLWDLVAVAGDASGRTMSRRQAVAALSRLLDAGLVNLAGEPLVYGGPTFTYVTLPRNIAIEVVNADAPWQPGGVFEIAGQPHTIWLGLTAEGRAHFEAGAAQDVVERVNRHLNNPDATRRGIASLRRLIQKHDPPTRKN